MYIYTYIQNDIFTKTDFVMKIPILRIECLSW